MAYFDDNTVKNNSYPLAKKKQRNNLSPLVLETKTQISIKTIQEDWDHIILCRN